MMRKQLEFATAMEIEPEKFRPHKIFRVKGKNEGRSGFRKQRNFLGLSYQYYVHSS